MPRPMWSGAISFGLVNIPVKLYKATAATSGKAISFHQIHQRCGTRLKHLRWCPKDEVEVPWDEVAKGYEVARGRYVEVTDAELDELLPDDDHAAIAIDAFVALDEVDPIYYDRAYYLSPAGSTKAYGLLHESLRDSGRVAVARVMLRTRSHLALIRTFERHLVLETLYFAGELVDVSEVPGLGARDKVDKREQTMARQLVDAMTATWEPERYRDEYVDKARELIERKVKGGEVVESPLAEPAGGGQVVDLVDALRRSLGGTGKKGAAPAAERAPAKRTSSARATSRRPAKRTRRG